jgi:hypothetical protein
VALRPRLSPGVLLAKGGRPLDTVWHRDRQVRTGVASRPAQRPARAAMESSARESRPRSERSSSPACPGIPGFRPKRAAARHRGRATHSLGTIQLYFKNPLPRPAAESRLVQGLHPHGAHVPDTWLQTLDS